jgi:hypothetical protein
MNASTILPTAAAACVTLTVLTYGLTYDRTVAPADPLDAAIVHQASRVEAARAAINARPLIGSSHLPKFDAIAAVEREEAEWRRLVSLRRRMAVDAERAATGGA